MKVVKLISKKKTYKKIYYGKVIHEDKDSLTILGCEEECDHIVLETLPKDEYNVSGFPADLLKRFMDKCLLYRNRKHDSLFFDYDKQRDLLKLNEERYAQVFSDMETKGATK